MDEPGGLKADRTGPIIFSQNYIFQQLTRVHSYLLTYSLTFILNCKSHLKVRQINVESNF